MIENVQLSEHFSFFELSFTTNGDLLSANRSDARKVMKQLRYTAATLEELRAVLECPLKVTSGFRNEELNKRVGGSQTSKHKMGLCADIIPLGRISVKEAFERIMRNKDKCPSLRKCIIEGVKGSTWLHIQTKMDANELTQFYSTDDGKNFTEVKA